MTGSWMRINRYSKLELPVRPTLLFEFHGISETVGSGNRAGWPSRSRRNTAALGFAWETTPAGRERLWKARHDVFYAVRALRPGSEVLTTDVCVPISRLAECIVDYPRRHRCDRINCHHRGPRGRWEFPRAVHAFRGGNCKRSKPSPPVSCERAQAMGGTCTGEHGVGLGKKKYLACRTRRRARRDARI